MYAFLLRVHHCCLTLSFLSLLSLPQMICHPDLTLALAICNICGLADFEEMTEVILNIFDYFAGMIKFLKASIERKVVHTGK